MRFGWDTPDSPELPIELDYLLQAFWSLNNRRTNNGFGLNPVQWVEMEAWQRGTGDFLTNDEAGILMSLFTVFDVSVEENSPKKPEVGDNGCSST